jgi:hypothetical protein
MAQLHSQFSFTGRLGNISAYKMKGSDKIILRTQGGATKNKIKKSPAFEKTRRINAEFGGRSTASKYLLHTLAQLKSLADYNIAGPLNALIKPIQIMDTEAEWGQRGVHFTKKPKLLEGFNLNRRNPFDSIVRNPVSYVLSREELSGRIDIPRLIPGINFFTPPGHYPYYSFVAALGVIPDLFFSKFGYEPQPGLKPYSKTVYSDWYPVLNGSPVLSLETGLVIPGTSVPGSSWILMLSVGIRFGTVSGNNEVVPAKYAGAAKILAVT